MRLGCWNFWSVDRLGLRGVGWEFGGGDFSVAFEAAGSHCGDGLGVLHESIPYEGGAEILRHQETDAEIDADDLGVVPVEVGMEGVAKTVAAPGVFGEVVAHGA